MNELAPCKVISVTNQKGGVGKTATTRLLADILLYKGYNVLLIDLDPQASLTKGYDLNPELFTGTNMSNITRIFEKGKEVSLVDITPESKLEDESNNDTNRELGILHIMPSNKELGIVSQSGTIGKETALKRYIKEANFKEQYDVIIIDNNPKFDSMTINSILACDTMVIPVIASRDEQDGIKGFIDSTEETLDAYEHTIEKMVIIPTMHEENTKVFKDYLEIMRESIPPYLDSLEHLGKAKNTVTKTIPKSIAFREGSSLSLSAYSFILTPRGKNAIKKSSRESLLKRFHEITNMVMSEVNNG